MTDPAVVDPRTGPGAGAGAPKGLDLDRLAAYLAAHRPELAAPPLRARLIAGGKSNLTYALRVGEGATGRQMVLRRPPLGHVLATAHDMAREHRIISALAPTAVPVPAALLLCPDPAVLGAPFYLMEKVDGEVFRSRSQTDALTAGQRRDLAMAMMDTLADLHAVDPAAVGLADFGRPEGFLGRQVRRWAAQLDQSRSRPLPGIDELRAALAGSVPEGANAGRIVHGDYRLDNLLATVGAARSADGTGDTGGAVSVRAVLDWEMATLGDPLADLGLLLTYWDVLGDSDAAAGNPVADGLGPRAGFPAGRELIERYAGRADVDVGPLHWHVALGCFKLAVICEGIHYRHTLGQTLGGGFDRIGDMVAPLVEHGLRAVREQ
ncbi:Predicted kinase, aminoglycoside phosphotransferase (APT) family [Micromonospora haikouensis]|uniref:Predicted kinase, aminoglycoside phosphotransferase (APT) family n=1 Tax=Micromonospora haikouensis TaxID=686309 RepID=A0A1C4YG80_9ACTN|nr:phosphotransferase family protein [Micromonospora haikouensis]SCF19714.1 Predicted kinase, aminoglycoside phosphotransferase (APT) family [Micromonospora haikouensis]